MSQLTLRLPTTGSSRRDQAQKKTAVVVYAPNNVQKQKKKKGARRRGRVRASLDSVSAVPGQWATLLNYPFENAPFRFGMGTMVNTGVGTLYKRGTLVANADGTFAIAVLPFASMNGLSPILTNNGGAISTAWTGLDWANIAALRGIYGSGFEFRVLAGGLRVIPSIAATSAPGELFAGASPSGYLSAVTALTATTIPTESYMHPGNAADGASVTMRPQDIQSFAFYPEGSSLSTTIVGWSIPMISGAGLPASTPIYYEAVLQVEVLASMTGQFGEGGDRGVTDGLLEKFSSMENLFRVTEKLTNDAVSLTSRFANFMSTGGALLGAGMSAYSYLAGGRRSQRFNRNLLMS